MPFFLISAILTPLSGDFSAKDVAIRQPLKLAAMEAHFKTEKSAPLIIGGFPDVKNEVVHGAIKIPYLLSILAFNDPYAVVKGLDAFPKKDWPPLIPVHIAFQVMVAIGTYAFILAIVFIISQFLKVDLLSNSIFSKFLILGTSIKNLLI